MIVACVLGCSTQDGQPFPAPDGYVICDRCMTRLRDTLHEVIDRWHRIVPTRTLLPAVLGIERHSAGYESAAPGNVHIMALRDVRTVAVRPGDPWSPLEVAHFWATHVRHARVITHPRSATVDSEIATLLFHFDWLSREFEADAVRRFAREFAEVRGQLRHVTDEPEPPTVGHCTAVVDGEPCGMRLHLPPGGLAIRCPRCRALYDGPKLVRLYQAEQGAEL